MSFYVITGIEVKRANAMTSTAFLGSLPIMAANMLAHSMGIKLGEQPTSVAYIHHNLSLRAEKVGYKKYSHHVYRANSFIDKNDYSGSAPGAPLLSDQPHFEMDLTCSLVLYFEAEHSEIRQQNITAQLEKIIYTSRLAGGDIIGFSNITACHSMTDFRRTEGEIQDKWNAGKGTVMHALPGGHWMKDCSHLIGADGQNRIDSMLAILNEKKSQQDKEAIQAWYCPAVLGYAMITPTEPRHYVRGGYEHAFSEPMVGLVEYRSVRKTPLTEKELMSFFWQYHWPQDDVFLLSQHSA